MMMDEEIGKALRQLPRTAASPRFKSDVLRAIRAGEKPKVVWRMLAATAMLLLVVGTYGASLHRQRQQRIRALRSESQQIASELRRVKVKADAVEPIVILENGDTRVIVANQQSTPIYY
jgi:hypothetical protein